MAWVRLDDHFLRHPKVVGLTLEAKMLFIAGLTYCADQLTDGVIPTGAVRLVAALATVEPSASAVGELAGAGLWEPSEAGYQVHDYLDYQPSRGQVLAERARNRDRQAAWRARNGVSHDVSNSGVTSAPYPYPEYVPGPGPGPDPGPEPGAAAAAARSITARRRGVRAGDRPRAPRDPRDYATTTRGGRIFTTLDELQAAQEERP